MEYLDVITNFDNLTGYIFACGKSALRLREVCPLTEDGWPRLHEDAKVSHLDIDAVDGYSVVLDDNMAWLQRWVRRSANFDAGTFAWNPRCDVGHGGSMTEELVLERVLYCEKW